MKAMVPVFILGLISIHCAAQNPDVKSGDIKTAPWFVERFRLGAGLFVPVSNTQVKVEIKGGAGGTEIDFENDLGLKSSQLTFLADFQWRISRRSRINLSYFNFRRSATFTLKKDITFKDQTYTAGSSANSFFNTAIYQITYGYAILAKPNYELGVLIGTHTIGESTGISLNGSGGSVSASTDFAFTAPLPDLGIWGGYAFSDRWAVNFEAVYLYLSVGDFSGRIASYNLTFMYRVFDKLDMSLGYSGLNCGVGIVKENVEGAFKWGYNGPSLGVTYSFGKKSWEH